MKITINTHELNDAITKGFKPKERDVVKLMMDTHPYLVDEIVDDLEHNKQEVEIEIRLNGEITAKLKTDSKLLVKEMKDERAERAWKGYIWMNHYYED